mmetsp:Transcript_54712/g.150764  ORF Transcript_54712/g.150764 Transcript_54712/m.150764 type:complete len:248 (+) Transcript_54712:1028-1771(+)
MRRCGVHDHGDYGHGEPLDWPRGPTLLRVLSGHVLPCHRLPPRQVRASRVEGLGHARVQDPAGGVGAHHVAQLCLDGEHCLHVLRDAPGSLLVLSLLCRGRAVGGVGHAAGLTGRLIRYINGPVVGPFKRVGVLKRTLNGFFNSCQRAQREARKMPSEVSVHGCARLRSGNLRRTGVGCPGGWRRVWFVRTVLGTFHSRAANSELEPHGFAQLPYDGELAARARRASVLLVVTEDDSARGKSPPKKY